MVLAPDLSSKLLCSACSRGRRKVVSIATLSVVTVPLGLVATLSIILISCHLGGAGLVPRRFKLLFCTLQIAELTFAAFVRLEVL